MRLLGEGAHLARRQKKRHSSGVAKPIEPTPTLYGEDAEQLLRELKDVCSESEAQRRLKKAEEFLAEVMRPPGWRKKTFGDS